MVVNVAQNLGPVPPYSNVLRQRVEERIQPSEQFASAFSCKRINRAAQNEETLFGRAFALTADLFKIGKYVTGRVLGEILGIDTVQTQQPLFFPRDAENTVGQRQ